MAKSQRSSVEILEKESGNGVCGDDTRWGSTGRLQSRRQKILTTIARLRVLPRLRRPSFTRSNVFRRREQNPRSSPEDINSWLSINFSSSQRTDSEVGGRFPQIRVQDQHGSANSEVSTGEQPPAIQTLDSHSLALDIEQIQLSDNNAEAQSLTSTLRPTELPESNSGLAIPTQARDHDRVIGCTLSTSTEAENPGQAIGSGSSSLTDAGYHDQVIESGSSTPTEAEDHGQKVGSVLLPSPPSTSTDHGETITEVPRTLARFQSFGERCYAALSIEVDRKLLDIFHNGLRQRIGRALNHSRLKDDRISIECLMVGEVPSLTAMSPTILFMCLTQAQKRTVVNIMNNLDFCPDLFKYKVVIHRIVTAGSSTRSQIALNKIGCFIEAGIPPSSAYICGTPAKILVGDEKGDIVRSTIGGFVMVNGVLFALTTAHGFADSGEKDCEDMEKDDLWTKQSGPAETTQRNFTRVGTLYFFEWTDESNNIYTGDSRGGPPNEELGSQDWALVNVSLAQHLTRENSFSVNGKPTRVEGYIQNEDLLFGDVWVCSGSRGALRGTLSGSTTSLMMGLSTFEVRSVYLDQELVGGDSGSWVIRDGRLCGYIFCRVVGLPLAYMLPIEPVIKEIARVLSDGNSRNVQIPAGGVSQILESGRETSTKTDTVDPAVNEASEVSISTPISEQACSLAECETFQTNADLEIVSEAVQTGANPWDKSYILSFDGGGVRGLSCLYLLKEVMLRIKDLERSMTPPAMSSFDPLPCLDNANEPVPVDGEGDATEKYLPCHYFDYMAGTNTGGLIAIMLSRLRMSVDDTILEFIDVVGKLYGKPRIFSMRGPIPWKRPRYNEELLKDVVKDLVARKLPPSYPSGDDKFNSNPEQCKTMVIAYGKRLENSHREAAYIFRSYPHFQHPSGKPPVRNAGAASSLGIDTVAQATIAAPSYFEPIEVSNWRFGDGGYGCNNPAAEAYFEARALHNESHSAIAVLVSLGTGDTDVSRFTDQKGFSGRLRQFINAGKVLASDKHGISKNLRTITDGIENSYYRFNAGRRLGEIKLDHWKGATESKMSTMDEIRVLTEQYLAEKAVQTWMDEIAHILVDNRRKRAKLETGKWEEALLGTRWRCEVPGCEEAGRLLRRQELEKHLRSYHVDQEANFQNLILCGKTRLV